MHGKLLSKNIFELQLIVTCSNKMSTEVKCSLVKVFWFKQAG